MSANVRVVVTDIEGTTSSLSFVKDVLFPYARARLPAFVAQHARDAAVRPLLDAARRELGREADDATLAQAMQRWIDEDRKLTPLKGLQGLIWEEGYRDGRLRGHVYDDAARALVRWKAAGIRLAVFSSGSVLAQKLLFGHSVCGDLTPVFDAYFDTTIGHKRDPKSYESIATALAAGASSVMFLSDVVEELDAARAAGMRTCLLAREGVPADARHTVARNFDEVPL